MHILPNWEKLTNDKCFMNNIENGQTYSKNFLSMFGHFSTL